MIEPIKTKGGDASRTPFRLARPGMALGLLACLFLFCLIVAGVILPFIPRLVARPESAVRISAVVQDLLIFILPAIGMAMVVTRLPARLLCIDRLPDSRFTIVALLTLVCSIPVMNCVVAWNESWHLPETMASAEALFRQLEDGARATVEMLIHGASVPSLIVSVLIVGFLAGFSEELFFRGALQRSLSMTRINPHVAIWLTAFLFSAFHFQLFGLVPRMLLGAFFGYMLWWSGSLWLPILCHVFNNTAVVLAEYSKGNAAEVADEAASGAVSIADYGSALSSPAEIAAVALSLLLTAAGIWMLCRMRRRE